MLPLLRYVSDDKEHRMRDVTDDLAKQLGVTEEEKKELLPSGAAPVFYNRTAWADCTGKTEPPFWRKVSHPDLL